MAEPYIQEILVPGIIGRVKEIIGAPLSHTDMLWVSVPLVFTLIMMEFYFGFYRDEELGWNTAFGNSLVLVFVGVDLLRQLFGKLSFDALSSATPQTLIALIILSQGLLMIMFNFLHALPKSLAFILASPISINLISYMGICIIYAGIPVDLITLIASFIIFVLLILVIDFVHLLMPRKSGTNVGKFITKLSELPKQS